MDALANYGSDDSNSSADDTGKGISGLLGHYSDSDNDEAATTSSNIEKANDIVEVNKEGNDNNTTNSMDDGQPNKKKRRRWDNPKDDDETADINSVLPTPKLSSTDTYQSLTTFNKDYTTNLRRKLAQQLQTQIRERRDTAVSAEKQQLNNKLEQLYEKFQQSESSSSTSSFFAKHIISNNDFGNPHLLKSVIDHYELKGLGSNIGNSFKPFEQIDRLVVAEEKARIAQANNL